MQAFICRYSQNIPESRITTLVISNEEIIYIIRIVKSLEQSGLLIKFKQLNMKHLKRTKMWISWYAMR